MDKYQAQRLSERIERDGDWRAQPREKASGRWTVRAYQREDGPECASDFASPYDWHYSIAKLKASMRRLKTLRFRITRATRAK